MVLALTGCALMLLGLAYLRYPAMFRRGIWMKTSIAIRTLSEANYLIYMRGLGVVQIVIGIVMVAAAIWRQQNT